MPNISPILDSQSVPSPIESEKLMEIPFIHKAENLNTRETRVSELVETASSGNSLEDILNAQRMHRFKSVFSSKFLQLMREQDFEYGLDTPADELVRKCLSENNAVTKEWINDLFIKHYHEHAIVIGILRVVAHINYRDVTPQGPTMALAALSHVNPEIRECGIRAFENWSTLDSLEILKNVRCPEPWLNEYVQQVISDLNEELKANVSFG